MATARGPFSRAGLRPRDAIRGGPDVIEECSSLVVEAAVHPQAPFEVDDRLIDPFAPISLDVFSPGQTIGGGVRAGLSRYPEGDRKNTSELQSQSNLVCRLLLEKKKTKRTKTYNRTR